MARPSPALSGRGILAIATVLMDVALGHGGPAAVVGAGEGGRGHRPRNRRGSHDSVGAGGVAVADADGDDVAVAVRQLRCALRQAAVFAGDRGAEPSGSAAAPGAAAAAGPAPRHIPLSWQNAPTSWLRTVARLYAVVPGRDPAALRGDAPGWTPPSVRAFVVALVLSRLRRVPTVRQLVLFARNATVADED